MGKSRRFLQVSPDFGDRLARFDDYALVRLSRVCLRLDQTTLVLFAAHST
jgi:hypothetical protein